MPLTYHRSVQQDILAVLEYYDRIGGPRLGDAFFEEFMAYVALVVEKPTRFHPVAANLRRANLDRFPYHFLYRIHGDTVRILVVRHHHRDPETTTMPQRPLPPFGAQELAQRNNESAAFAHRSRRTKSRLLEKLLGDITPMPRPIRAVGFFLPEPLKASRRKSRQSGPS